MLKCKVFSALKRLMGLSPVVKPKENQILNPLTSNEQKKTHGIQDPSRR